MPRKNLVILTGAGISAESGVPTFRGVDGLWEGHRIEEVASPEAFAKNPALVHRFYNLRRAALSGVRPNAAHEALARLEREWPGDFLLVTQNVDDLHDRAGSTKLIHMHGELLKVHCEACDTVHGWKAELSTKTICPTCAAPGMMRPHIVWFGEMPLGLDTIERALAAADLFVCIGTSGVVYPAAGFARIAALNGRCKLIEINIDRTGISRDFHLHFTGPATVEVPKVVASLLNES